MGFDRPIYRLFAPRLANGSRYSGTEVARQNAVRPAGYAVELLGGPLRQQNKTVLLIILTHTLWSDVSYTSFSAQLTARSLHVQSLFSDKFYKKGDPRSSAILRSV